MKKFASFFITAVVMCIAIIPAYSQTYSIVSNDTISMTGILEDLETLTIQQINIANNAITLEWQKVSENVPPMWEAKVCDNVICYSSLVNGGVMNPIVPGDFGFLMMHVTPHVNFGTSTIRYAVWDAAFPLLKDTLTYILTVPAPTGISNLNEIKYSLYPNPADEMIDIKISDPASFNYQISDNTGKIIDSGKSVSRQLNIKTYQYKNGIYFLKMIDRNGKSNYNKFVVQH